MIPEPIHPALVHFPIVLAVLLPFAAAGALVAVRRGARKRPVWSLAVVMAAVLFGAAFASVKTGEAQEEVVEDVLVSEEPLHEHEEAAERLLVLAGIVLALSPIGLLAGRAGTAGRAATTVASLALAAAAWPVGTSGGELVYRHGAAQAWVETASRNADAGAAEPGTAHDEHDDGS